MYRLHGILPSEGWDMQGSGMFRLCHGARVENNGDGQKGPALTKVPSSFSVSIHLYLPSSASLRFFIQAANVLDPHPSHPPPKCYLKIYKFHIDAISHPITAHR